MFNFGIDFGSGGSFGKTTVSFQYNQDYMVRMESVTRHETTWDLDVFKNEEESGYGDFIGDTSFDYVPMMQDVYRSIENIINDYEESINPENQK